MYAWSNNDRPLRPVKIGSKPVVVTARKKSASTAAEAVKVGERSGKYGENIGTWPKANLTSSQFRRKRDGSFTAKVCEKVAPGRCYANEGYRDGRRSLRFCVSPGQPGHVIDIEGMSPGKVRKLALEACAHFREKGTWKGSTVGKAALGGLRKPKRKKRKSARKARR